MAIQMQRKMEVAEYLEWEARQELKHEYIDGAIIEMTGGTLKHTRIKTNIGGLLFTLLDLSSFVLCNSDMRVRVRPTRYVYPDFSIVRGEPRLEDERELTLLNRPRADLYTPADEGWYLRVYDQLDDVVPLTSLNCELSLTDVYRGLE